MRSCLWSAGLSCLLFHGAFSALAQAVRQPVGGDYLALQAYLATKGHVLSLGANPAALAFCDTASVGVYGESRFLLPALSLYRLSATLPVGQGAFALHGARFGNAEGGESATGLGYGRTLGSGLAIGAGFNYLRWSATGYPPRTVVNFEAGLLLQLPGGFRAGLHIYNPAPFATATDSERLPADYSLGLGYHAAQNFSISAVTSKSTSGPITVRCGVTYAFAEGYAARFGFNTAASSYYVGWGLPLYHFRIEATACLHPQLSFTPSILLVWTKKNPK